MQLNISFLIEIYFNCIKLYLQVFESLYKL
jgi:hypothetical protein